MRASVYRVRGFSPRAYFSGRIKPLMALCLVTSLVGCSHFSSQSLFSHYSAAMASSRNFVEQGAYHDAQSSLPDEPGGTILDGMEKGRMALLVGETAASKEALRQADEAAMAQQRAALIQLSSGAQHLGALVTNNNVLEYEPADYELGFLHLYLILNHLQQRDLQGALVEVRRANQVQERARKIRERASESALATARENGISDNVGAVLARYASLDDKLNASQNGYLFYLSALLYEAEGNMNSAFIDYSRALAVAPDNPYVAQAAMRVASKQGRTDALAMLEKQYGSSQGPARGDGQLVIMSEQGVVTPRQFWRLPLWLTDRRGQAASYTLALPYYPSDQAREQQALKVDGDTVTPEALVNVNQMAKLALNEAMPTMVVRQVFRLVAKNELRQSMVENDESGIGSLVVSIFNVLSEQPDTRSWQTLPESAGVYSGFYPAGSHTIQAGEKNITVNIEPGKTTMLWLSRQAENLVYWKGILGGI